MSSELLFSGQLLTADDTHVQIEKESLSYLQQLADPLLLVSLHGIKQSGKTFLVHSLLGIEGVEKDEGVWIYIKRLNFPNAKYLAILDGPGFKNSSIDVVVYSILASLSSVVVHHVDGHLTCEAINQFAFIASSEIESSIPPDHSFPQSPKLLWVLQNITTNELKKRVHQNGLSVRETEKNYLCNAFASLREDSSYAAFSKLLETVFPDQGCFALQPRESETFEKRVEKLSRVFTDSIHNRYFGGVMLNGQLAASILVSMLAHRDNVCKVFLGRIWKETIYNCCLKVVENGIKLYMFRMSERLGSIVDISNMKNFKPVLARPSESQEFVELPCETQVLLEVHASAKRESKATLLGMPIRPRKLSALFMKLFRDLVESSFISIEDENNRISSRLCQSLLATLHTKMTEKVDAYLMSNNPKAQDSSSFQSTEFKRFYHIYQTNLFELMAEYTDQAKGPAKKEELAKFLHKVIQPQIAVYSEKLEKVRQHDVDVVEKWIQRKEVEIEEFNTMQRMSQKQAMDAQENVNTQLVEKAKLQALRKEALVDAINDLTSIQAMATKQKKLLEEAAFVSVQLPEQNVIKAAQDNKVSELQGYLIKQGGGGNVLNPLGRKNWKQRYFILSGTNLIYAKTKDDYERGKIIKELSLTGCRIDPASDAGEGFNITPGKSSHVFALQRGLFEKNNKKRSSAADNGRIFKLRAHNIQERDVWIDRLRQAAGGC